MTENDNIEFAGKCAFACALGKDDPPTGHAKHRVEKNGRTFYFSNPVAKFLWKLIYSRSV